MAHTHPLFIPSTFQIQFPIPNPHIVPKISPSPRLCETFRNAVSCYDVELLATRPTNKPEDTPFRMSVAVYSVYYQLTSILGSHLHHCNLRTCNTVMTETQLVGLKIQAHYTPPLLLLLLLLLVVISVIVLVIVAVISVTVLQKIFIP
jgi:hypothetical protein